jgi:two-component sensor histidine kinase
MAMVLHELATNAIRHGALSRPGGRLQITWQPRRRKGEDGTLRLRWQETGVPMPGGASGLAAPEHRGFGSRVIAATVRGQFGGALALDWTEDGMLCEIAIPLERWLTTWPAEAANSA